jgi:hypothetical protein
MGDCYYHGSYGGYNCPECEEERSRGLEQGSISVDPDIYLVKQQMAAREANLPLGLDPNGNKLKKKGE